MLLIRPLWKPSPEPKMRLCASRRSWNPTSMRWRSLWITPTKLTPRPKRPSRGHRTTWPTSTGAFRMKRRYEMRKKVNFKSNNL